MAGGFSQGGRYKKKNKKNAKKRDTVLGGDPIRSLGGRERGKAMLKK